MHPRHLLFPLLLAVAFASCKKDDTEAEVSVITYPDNTPAYEMGRFNPAQHLSAQIKDGDTTLFLWDDDGNDALRLSAIERHGRRYPATYNDDGQIVSMVIAPTDILPEHSLNFTYTSQLLSQMDFRSSIGLTLMHGDVTCDGQKIKKVEYSSIDPTMLMPFVNSFLPAQTDGDHLIKSFNLTALNTQYSWTGDNVSGERLEASASADLQIGVLVDKLHLDTSFYRLIIGALQLDTISSALSSFITPELIEQFINAMHDSVCHVTIDVDMTKDYTYDACANPIYGFWGFGLLGRTHVLSHNNIVGETRGGAANVHLHVNLPQDVPDGSGWQLQMLLLFINLQYPDGLDYTFPIDLTKTTSLSITYSSTGMPTIVTKGQSRTTYLYAD